MEGAVTRRRFLRRTGTAMAGAYALANSIPAAVARAATGLDGASSTLVTRWNAAALQAIRETHPGPPMVARMLAMVHTAMYDAWAAYDPVATGTRLGSRLRRPAIERTAADMGQAVSVAAHRVLRDLFPGAAQVAAFDALLASVNDPAAHVQATQTGRRAADAVIAFRHEDGSNQLNGYADTTGYRPVNTPDAIIDPDHWQPLRVGTSVQQYVAPHWGQVTPFALTSPSQFRPASGPKLYALDRAAYELQAQQVVDYTASLDDQKKVIAEYWADGPSSELPPGHWCLFAQHVSRRDGHSLSQDVKMFFAMTNAIFDGSIAAWEAKRHFDLVRPVTAIHFLFAGRKIPTWPVGNKPPRRIDGAEWRPYQAASVVTPPFPEYVSGHSTFSAAGAEVLARFTGSDTFGASTTVRAGSSAVETGVAPATDITLTWPTFSAAADEAGISRRYGGIHFIDGDLDGRSMGRSIGAQAYKRAQAYIDGEPHRSGHRPVV